MFNDMCEGEGKEGGEGRRTFREFSADSFLPTSTHIINEREGMLG